MTDWDVYDHPPPIPVTDGIRARSRRGDIGETWWSRRFVAALEGYYTTTASRLSRGRSYARAGQTTELTLEPGLVRARVQGSRPSPYAVSIRIRVLGDADWDRVEAAMASRAVFLARLLAGEMPDEIEEAFAGAGLSLFPSRRGDLVTRCSCPDDANPCKHIAAVFYLLAESFDADPFRMLEWRGRPRNRLIAELRARRPAPAAAGARGVAGWDGALGTAEPADPGSIERVWSGSAAWSEVRIEPHPTAPPDALLREMDPLVLEVLGPDAPAALRPIYGAAAAAARRLLDPSIDEVRPARRRRRAGA